MNQLLPIQPPDANEASASPADPVLGLGQLAQMISIDAVSGDLVIRNGLSRIVLMRNGMVRIEGRRILQSAIESVSIEAATIDLN